MRRKKAEKWITASLVAEVKQVFEPRYNRKLTNQESREIALRLESFVETYAKWRWKNNGIYIPPKAN